MNVISIGSLIGFRAGAILAALLRLAQLAGSVTVHGTIHQDWPSGPAGLPDDN